MTGARAISARPCAKVPGAGSSGSGSGSGSSSTSAVLGVIPPPLEWRGDYGCVRLLRLSPDGARLFAVYDNGSWARFSRGGGAGTVDSAGWRVCGASPGTQPIHCPRTSIDLNQTLCQLEPNVLST